MARRIEYAVDTAARLPADEMLDFVENVVGTSLASQESVPAAFAVLAALPADPWRVVCAAASVGGDCDTIAAIAGAIAGAVHGTDGFPRVGDQQGALGQPARPRSPGTSTVGPAVSLTTSPAGVAPVRLLLMGNIPVDVVLRVPAVPAVGADVVADAVDYRPGGGFHVLSAASQAGLRGRYAGAHGTGHFGDLVRGALADINAELLQLPTPDRDTGLVFTLVDAAGERTFVTAPGAVVPFSSAMLSRVRPASSDIVYVGGYSLGLGLGAASDLLAAWVVAVPMGHQVFCDLGPHGVSAASRVLEPLLRRVDWLSLNAREAAQLTGEVLPRDACAWVRRRTPRAGVLVRVGPDGCWLAATDQDPELIPAPFVHDVVDTNGAGDTHAGRFLAGLAAGMDPAEAVQAANTAAANWVGA